MTGFASVFHFVARIANAACAERVVFAHIIVLWL